MAGPSHVDQDMEDFQNEVQKTIVAEAPADAWYRPRRGDVVALEVHEIDDAAGEQRESAFVRTWKIGATPVFSMAGLDIERCARTMRCGEEALVRPKDPAAAEVEASASTRQLRLRLLALERTEDLLGDGTLVRTTLHDGAGWQTPQAGMELRVRYSWRPASASSSATTVAVAAAADEDIVVTLGGGIVGEATTFSGRRGLRDLLRALLRRYPAEAVQLRGAAAAEVAASGLCEDRILEVRRGDTVLLSEAAGLTPEAAQGRLASILAPNAEGATNSSAIGGFCAPKEVVVCYEENRLVCSAHDWLPNFVALRVLSDMREGQRCLLSVAADLMAIGAAASAEAAPREYDIELLRILTLEDISLDLSRSAMKKVMKEGEGYDRPTDGAQVTVRVEARDDASGAVLLEERDLTFDAGSQAYCAAIAETVLTMKKGEFCEVRFTDPATWLDEGLDLRPSHKGDASAVVILSLELLDLEKIDMYGAEESDRIAYCTKRKEVGTRFFQTKQWRRALRRYKCVTNVLAYLDHWKDSEARAEAVILRRACNLNSAACSLKLEAWADAIGACDEVLRDEPHNAKALFRKGQALKELGHLEEAERSLRKVHDLDPEDKEVVRLLRTVRQLIKDEERSKRELFSRMAKGLGADTDQLAKSKANVVCAPAEKKVRAFQPSLGMLVLGGAALSILLVGAMTLRRLQPRGRLS